MAFHSVLFLLMFGPLVLLLYRFVPVQGTAWFFILTGILFYAWGSPAGLIILLLGSAVNYRLTLMLTDTASPPGRFLLPAAIIFNVGILFVFKYMNFFMGELNRSLSLFGQANLSWTTLLFPMGISFITFHQISYLIQNAQGKANAPRTFSSYLAYILFFPKLLQGPITQYSEFAQSPCFTSKPTLEQTWQGLYRFVIGLSKKVLIADIVGQTALAAFSHTPSDLTAPQAWLGAVAYSFQIYFDFSAYTDMALGLALMMGVALPENFNQPYRAVNFTDFWRRWHITLSRWFRQYLYIPLGGNRTTPVRTYLNLWIVFLVSGLWHGANWTFILWGAYHGLFLCIDKFKSSRTDVTLSRPFGIALTFILITLGWVLFNSPDIGYALQYYKAMFSLNAPMSEVLMVELISNRGITMLVLAAVLSFIPYDELKRFTLHDRLANPRMSTVLTSGVLMFCLILLSLAALLNAGYKPYIYLTF